MSVRGRRPFEVNDTVAYGLPNPRLRPPASLPDPERQAFVKLMASCPAGQFQASDMPLLCLWATVTVQLEQAAGELARGGMVVDAKPSPWFQIQQQAARTLALLALRLRLGPQSRTRMAPKKKPSSLSYYDLQRLGGDDAEDKAGEAN